MDDFDRDIRSSFHARQLPAAPDSLLDTLGALPARPVRTVFSGLRLGLGMAAAFVVVAVATLVLSAGGAFNSPVGSPGPVIVSPAISPLAPASTAPSSAPSQATVPSTTPSTPAPTPTTTPPAGQIVTPGANVTAAGLVDADHGWAIAGQRIVFTSDDGATWRDITPPAINGVDLNILGAEFLDRDTGWVAIGEPFSGVSDPHFGRVDTWRTTDGGGTWTKSELPRAKVNNQGDILPALQFDFLDADHGFAFLGGNLAKGLSDSDLYYTSDGGKTWSADRPTGSGSVGVEGNVSFASADDGVIVGSPNGSGVYVTSDGGLTWHLGTLPAPSGATNAGRAFGTADFLDANDGLLAVRFDIGSTNTTKVYRSTVSGQTFGLRSPGSTWTPMAVVPGGGTWDVTFLDAQHWIAADGTNAIRTSNAGASWTTVLSHPATLNQQRAFFVDLNHGWQLDGDTQGNGYLAATSDSGQVWRTIAN